MGRNLIFLDFITSIFMLLIWLVTVSVLELTLYTITNPITLRVRAESKSRELFYSLTRYSFPVNFKIRPYVRTKKNRNGCAARLNREIR